MRAKYIFLGILFLCFSGSTASAQGARSFKINEIVVDNPDGYVDEYGERSGWIEIANTSWGTNDLRSCYLTSNREVLKPSLSVPERVSLMSLIPKGDPRTHLTAKQNLVFFADGRTNRGTTHLNFKLIPGKENFIALYDANGRTLLDSVTVPAALTAGQSYARSYDGRADAYVWKIVEPDFVTAGFPNNSGDMVQDKVAEFKQKDPHGFGMSIMGMGLVLGCLSLLYVSFRLFGRISSYIERVNRFRTVQAMRMQARKATNIAKHGVETRGVDKEVYAAVIAMALSAYEEEAHDVESSVITLRQASSNWSAKSLTMGKKPVLNSNKNK